MKKWFLLIFGIVMLIACDSVAVPKQEIIVHEQIAQTQEPVRETVSATTQKTKSHSEQPSAPNVAEPPTPNPKQITTVPSPAPSPPEYTVWRVNSSSLLNKEELPWAKELSFNIVQVEDMEDEALQEKINKNILYAMTHWVEDMDPVDEKEGIVWLIPITDEAYSSVYIQTDSYLSMSNYFFLYSTKRSDAIIDVVTINMKTGERVKLNDLFDVNIELSERIVSLNEDMPVKWPTITEPENLLMELQEASMDNLEIAKVDYPNLIGTMMGRTSFHLEPNKLIITFHRQGALPLDELDSIALSLDDYEDFLLVDKW